MERMPGTDTRQRLIRVGSAIMARHGFNHTGIGTVLAEAGVPKGSFYYYFASKADFGLAVIEAYEIDHRRRLEALLGDAGVPPLQRIRNYFEAGLEDMAAHDYGQGCPIGNLSQELAALDEVFRTRLDAVFEDWRERFTRCLEAAGAAGDIPPESDFRQLAECLLSGWQGATLRSKVTRSLEPMQAFADVFLRQVLGPPRRAASAAA